MHIHIYTIISLWWVCRLTSALNAAAYYFIFFFFRFWRLNARRPSTLPATIIRDASAYNVGHKRRTLVRHPPPVSSGDVLRSVDNANTDYGRLSFIDMQLFFRDSTIISFRSARKRNSLSSTRIPVSLFRLITCVRTHEVSAMWHIGQDNGWRVWCAMNGPFLVFTIVSFVTPDGVGWCCFFFLSR